MNRTERQLRMMTISKDLSQYYPDDVKKIQLFNFNEGKFELQVLTGSRKKMIGTIDNCWIRVFDTANKYYDFISSEIYFDADENGVYLLASEDTEFISVTKVGEMISDYIEDLKEKKMTNTQYVDRYTLLMLKEIKVAAKELHTLQAISQGESDASRLDIEDSYEYGRTKLIRKYLLNLIASRMIKENKQAILEFISN